ncbi:MAG: exodeoxyribonuclease V subunit gamma [Thiolinea sp.]
MLQLFHSNRLEILAEKFAEVVSAGGLDPFVAEQVVVQNAGMGRWLSLQLAQQTGIAANLKYLFPAEITWELLRAVLPDVPERDPCSPGLLRWRLLEELEQRGERYQQDLGHYLRPPGVTNAAGNQAAEPAQDSGAAWQLAKQVALVFDGYLFFRPDWVQEWDKEPAKDWQQFLWRNVITQPGLDNSINLQARFIRQLALTPAGKLPRRISFFSVPALSPAYIEMLAKVAEKTDVYFYVMNPSWQYWGDIESRKQKIKRELAEQEYVTVGNPLLASWGTQGRDFIENLRAIDPYPQETDAFEEPSGSSLLHHIQADILNLEGDEAFSDSVSLDITGDLSVCIHSCHSPMREVEVLYDQLLAAMEHDKTLTPADMVVMSPEIEAYAPFVEAVFASAPVYLPYSIADQRFSAAKNISAACLQLMELPQGKFEADTVFSLLEYQEVRACFGLDDAQVQTCRDWVRAVNIRWGVDEEFRRQFASQTTFEHTWIYGLDRLLLGYMMPGDELLTGILPYNELEGSEVLVLERFLQCVHTLFPLARWSNQLHDMDTWCDRFAALTGHVFAEDAETYGVTQAIDKLRESVRQAEFKRPVAWSVFRDALKTQLEQNNRADGFLGSGITFCTLMPMRSVPFKFVALLGMQDGGFPRQDTRISFDKLAHDKRRRGDRSRRDEDRYLFLESLLSARERVYVSYVGQSVLDNAPVMPSVLVSELLDYIEKRYCITPQQLTTKHPLQAFSKRYFNGGELFSYRSELAQLQSGDQEQHDGLPFWEGQVLDEPDEALRHITLADLVRFYRQPARQFLRQRFDLILYEEDEALAGREPFALEPFSDTLISQQILSHYQADKPAEQTEATLRARGLLPHGTPGELLFKQQYDGVVELASQLPEVDDWRSFEVFLQSEQVEMRGELTNVSAQGRHILLFGYVGAWQWLEIWLQHLALNAAVRLPDDWSRLTCVYTAEKCYVLQPVENADQQLQALLDGYWQGLQQPLPFFPKSAWKMMEAKEPQIETALREWLANDMYHRGEALKPEYQLLYRGQSPIPEHADEFMGWAELIFGSLFRCRE